MMVNRAVTWLEDWFYRAGRGVLRMVPNTLFAPGHFATLPTAGNAFDGATAHTSAGTWVCQPDGAGGYEWVLLGDAASFAYGTGFSDVARGSHTHDTLVWAVSDVDLGAAKTSGQFTIDGTNLTLDSPVIVRQIAGDRPDELEMDQFLAAGCVTSPDTITCYWQSASVMGGPARVAWQAI